MDTENIKFMPVPIGTKFVYRTVEILGPEYADARKPPFEGQMLTVVGFKPRYKSNVVVREANGNESLLPLHTVEKALSLPSLRANMEEPQGQKRTGIAREMGKAGIPVMSGHKKSVPAIQNKSLNLVEILSVADSEIRAIAKTLPVFGKALARLKAVICSGEAGNSFEFLCEQGCDRDELTWLLAACAWDAEHERMDQITELDDRELRSTVKRFDMCAAEIEHLSHTSAMHKMLKEVDLTEPLQIPQELRDFGALLEFIASLRARIYWTLARKRLIHYVESSTGQFWDKHIAELIATVTNRDNYEETAHRQWRFRNRRDVTLQISHAASASLEKKATELTKFVFCVCESWFVHTWAREDQQINR